MSNNSSLTPYALRLTPTYRIYYEDTDAGGVVYYANYLKFFERARTDLLREMNISQSNLAKDEQLVFVVRKCTIEYKEPAKLDDLIEIKTSISEVNSASILMHQEMFRGDKILNILDVEIVSVDAISFKPKRIPLSIKANFSK